MNRARLGLAGLVLALAGLPATAQSPPANPQPAQDAPTYSEEVGTEYVLLPVLVFDKKGRFVDGLTKKDFRVRVDTTPVEIDEFERDEGAPVSMAFLVDTS
ncbi:MAG TPA: hypothetical protein VFW81_01160, partial [Thermoanaerobaculia bacterium]|nr:hypothetical protein [Thermoanaerobaculia bacterium]